MTFDCGAMHGAPAAFAESAATRSDGRRALTTGGPRHARRKQTVHIVDIAGRRSTAAIRGWRKLGGRPHHLGVPMLKDNELVGAIVIYRQEVRPFTDKQIELVTNFAAQAVIAIENTRLLNELRQRTDDLSESLEQQTATTEVLQGHHQLAGRPQPVFDAMVGSAMRILRGQLSARLLLTRATLFHRVAAHGEARYLDWITAKRSAHA